MSNLEKNKVPLFNYIRSDSKKDFKTFPHTSWYEKNALKSTALNLKMWTNVCQGYQKIISMFVTSDTIVVGQFHYKMWVLWTISNHCLTPLAIIRTEKIVTRFYCLDFIHILHFKRLLHLLRFTIFEKCKFKLSIFFFIERERERFFTTVNYN